MYLDLRALRNDRVTLTERGAPHSLALMESGKLLPGVNVIIANPDTKGQCGDSHLGEASIVFRATPLSRTGFFCALFEVPRRTEVSKNLSFWTFDLSFTDLS